jgi:hypothetical protein
MGMSDFDGHAGETEHMTTTREAISPAITKFDMRQCAQ